MPHPGRPVSFDEPKQQSFLQFLSQGLTIREAARHAGVSPSTVYDKKQTCPGFAAACAQAKAKPVPTLLDNIHSAAKGSWRASAWLLERIRPDLFGRRVALGLDPAQPKPPKPAPDFVPTDEMLAQLLANLELLPGAKPFDKQWLAELEEYERVSALAPNSNNSDNSPSPEIAQPQTVQ